MEFPSLENQSAQKRGHGQDSGPCTRLLWYGAQGVVSVSEMKEKGK